MPSLCRSCGTKNAARVEMAVAQNQKQYHAKNAPQRKTRYLPQQNKRSAASYKTATPTASYVACQCAVKWPASSRAIGTRSKNRLLPARLPHWKPGWQQALLCWRPLPAFHCAHWQATFVLVFVGNTGLALQILFCCGKYPGFSQCAFLYMVLLLAFAVVRRIS